MISCPALLADAKQQLAALEADLRLQAALPAAETELRSGWRSARTSFRTSASFEAWRDEQVTQIAASWLLCTVFLRFCEDNGLIPAPFLAGPRERLRLAENRQHEFLRQNADVIDRHWLLRGIEELRSHPLMADLLNPRHAPMGQIEISDAAARDLIAFWRTQDTDEIAYDFTDPELDTRFLGDLYQDLSEHERAAYALLQTPDFIEEFILDQTLQPAVDQFGLEGLRIIDPVCGSGTFLLGSFHHLMKLRKRSLQAADSWDIIRKSLASVHGVDKNPMAVSIARFRLIVAAMKAGGARKLADIPDLRIIVATGDSLIHGREAPSAVNVRHSTTAGVHYLRCEDVSDFSYVDLLGASSYHAVVGNPPYITPKDKAESEAYRAAYPVCTGNYALTVPFIIRFFLLSVHDSERASGHIGLLSSNSFMKREFGRSLIEQFFPTVDLTSVIDTSGAFIPGHGTPTVILLGRNRLPGPGQVGIIVGLRGEPEIPRDPAQGHVWCSILSRIAQAPDEDEWTQYLEIDRSVLFSFPWNLADSTTTRILDRMASNVRLSDRVTRIGYFASTGSDDVFTAPPGVFRRMKVETEPLIPVITGSEVRDWTARSESEGVVFPGSGQRPDIARYPGHLRRLWPYRTVLGERRNYSGRTYFEDGRPWFEWHHITETPEAHPWSIVFPWVSTHNHFAVLRDRAAPLNSAPVIRLPKTASDSDVLQLTALLNSSLICFWLKQYSNSKGQPKADQTGTGEPWTLFYEFTSTRLSDLPLPPDRWSKDRWSVHADGLDSLAQELAATDPRSLLVPNALMTNAALDAASSRWEDAYAKLVARQEELDWEIYGRYGLVDEAEGLCTPVDAIPGIAPGERAFEIVLARRMAQGKSESTWFARHNIVPVTDLPSRWPERYREVVAHRIEVLEQRSDIRRIEQPEFKRRWLSEPWGKREKEAIRQWLLDRCEQRDHWYVAAPDGSSGPCPLTVSGLARLLSKDQDFAAMASRYAGKATSLTEVVAELFREEHVPYLAAFRHTGNGLLKRVLWEQTWNWQRTEDESILLRQSPVPVPPRYTSADYLKAAYWRQRGKLDVPNERFISYPRTPPDEDLIVGWAGWNLAERAYVLIGLIEGEGRSDGEVDDAAIPLLAGLRELLPWLRQWHREPESPFGTASPADEVTAYLGSRQAEHMLRDGDIAAWRPPSPKRGRPRKIQRS
jgi:hypothetical protein